MAGAEVEDVKVRVSGKAGREALSTGDFRRAVT